MSEGLEAQTPPFPFLHANPRQFQTTSLFRTFLSRRGNYLPVAGQPVFAQAAFLLDRDPGRGGNDEACEAAVGLGKLKAPLPPVLHQSRHPLMKADDAVLMMALFYLYSSLTQLDPQGFPICEAKCGGQKNQFFCGTVVPRTSPSKISGEMPRSSKNFLAVAAPQVMAFSFGSFPCQRQNGELQYPL